MKLRKIFAGIAAAAVAVSTMALTAISASAYNAYIGVQTNPNWIFRNAWNDGTFGRDNYEHFNSLSADGKPADIEGTFTDVEFTTDGTYKVSLTGADLSDEEIFSLLFVSTDVPLSDSVTFSNVKVIIDGNTKYTFDEAYVSPDDTEYFNLLCINIWNGDVKDLFGYVMPNSSVEIEFTVSGLGDGAAAEPEAPAADAGESAPAADAAETTTTAPATGNVAVASVAAVMTVAGAAMIASRKRK